VWNTITNNAKTPRNKLLINLNPSRTGFRGQAAIRIGQWKLITGLPNCSLVSPVRNKSPCPDGWIHLDGTIEPPPNTPSFTWLFNIENDPNERNNVADQHPEIVK